MSIRWLWLFAFLTVFVPYISYSAVASAQELWATARAGMSIGETKAQFPDAVRPADPSHLAGSAVELLQIPHLEISNSPFRVRFYFRNEKLSQVTLNYLKKERFESALITYNNIVPILRSKYGQEIAHDSKRGTERYEWATFGKSISALLTAVGNNDAIFNINYRARVKADVDKL